MQLLEKRPERAVQRRYDREPSAIEGMSEYYLPCMEQHAMAIELLAEELIVLPVAMSGVADDRVKDVLQVAPDLVAAARKW